MPFLGTAPARTAPDRPMRRRGRRAHAQWGERSPPGTLPAARAALSGGARTSRGGGAAPPGAGTGTASHGSWLIKVFCLRILLAVN